MFSKSISVSTLLLVALLWSGLLAWGQSTGTISGTVSDQSGAIVAGATVKITNKATGVARDLTSNGEGLFSAPSLEPGQYEVRVEASGFRTLVRDAEVFAGTSTTVNTSMTVGESQQVINVEASATQINYDNNTIAGVVERKTVQDIPLNGRSFFQLASLEPGITVVANALGARNEPVTISIMGMSATATYLSVDGLSIMDGLELAPILTLSQEMVQEFQVSTVNYQVGPAVTAFGAVNIVSRSGSNQFHGSGFFFYRDHNMAAYPGLKRITFAPNPYYARKDPGFWLSGPIVKDKAFFFYDWEPQKQIQAVVFQPDLASLAPLAAVFPSPNIQRSMNARFDYRVSDKHTSFFRYTHDGNKNFGVPSLAPTEPSQWNHLNNWSDQYAMGITSTIKPTLVNDFRFGFRLWNNAEAPPFGSPALLPGTASSPQCVLPCVGSGLPQLSMIGSTNFAAGESTNAKQNRIERHYNPQDTISLQKGTHSIKFGADLDVYVSFFEYDFAPLGVASVYSVESTLATLGNAASTLMPNLPKTISTTNDLLNLPVRFGANAFAVGQPFIPGPYHFESERRNIRYKLFGSDTWKVKPNFTVNYGASYTYEAGLLPSDVPIPSYEAPLFGLPVGSKVGPTQTNRNEFGPVLGFAWSLGKNGKTVIRGGAGEYWDTQSDWLKAKDLSAVGPLGNGRLNVDSSVFTNIFPNIMVQNGGALVPLAIGAPILPNIFSTMTLGQFLQIYNQQIASVNALFSPANPQTSGAIQAAAIQYAKDGAQLYAPTFPITRSYQTSLGVQRDLGHDMVLTADWARRQFENVSLSGVDLNHYSEVTNGVQTSVIPKCTVAPDFNPNDDCSLGAFSFNYDEGREVYEGLLVRLQKRMSKHYQFTTSYALQRLLGFTSVVNFNNYAQANGQQLAHQNLNISGLGELPWGFELSLNSSMVSRTPVMPVTTGVDLSGTAATASTPLPGLPYNCGGVTCGKAQLVSAVEAFNSTYAGTKAPNGATIPAYVLPPDYQFGDPQIYQDVRLTKTFTYKERYRLAIMGEFFNVFNIANLSGYSFNLDALGKGCTLTAPGSAFTSCSTQTYAFGQPTNRAQQTFLSGGPRAIQVGARFSF
jgi:carboxypeptidase family protein